MSVVYHIYSQSRHTKESHFEQLNSKPIAIQKAISVLVFKPLGTNLARDVADLEVCEPRVDYEIYIRNGKQTLRYCYPLVTNDSFSNKIIEQTWDLIRLFKRDYLPNRN